MKVLVTGGAGFIGSNFIHYWLKNHPEDQVVNLDALTYAGHLSSLKDIADNPNYRFIEGNITDPAVVEKSMTGVDIVINFAAESHVDRSVIDPVIFSKSNTLGTTVLLKTALDKKIKRFHHVSTDEVYGSLGPNDPAFSADTPYKPRTPYAASKAGADHMVRAFFETYNLPITITNCANNFGPYHDPEKLIPRFITNLLEGEKVPLMGKGENIREWLYVEDHASAIDTVLQKGKSGETYLIEGEEKTNLEITQMLLKILNMGEEMIEFVEHRLGHDFRYANDGSKLSQLGWQRKHNLEEGLKETVNWFKENQWWWKSLKKDRPNVDRAAQKGYNG